MTSILTLIFGVTPTTGVGTNLAYAALNKGLGTATHRLRGNIKWDIVVLLGVASVTTATTSILTLK